MIEPDRRRARVNEVQKGFSDIVIIFSGIGFARSFTFFTKVAGCLLQVNEVVDYWVKYTNRGYKALGLRGQACMGCPFAPMNKEGGCQGYYQEK
ncbi:hypothetical protein A2767_00720 [Candidatus Roizmanbacteria bacterium RIFCSPHIGHO2_01_FULL_35_10]|uniref:Uncharacterized protein n=1 Tax=Candidatus Roizmanbacteria bacterium RIFCSPLOWO2_01_FULL_35_13 TaxID=1802055 RepID=A0A1F7I921_9BACT|nr:MAG: hypothetical protein A2767_00720 [Candidatus Roizmanbacteria bacterium RIFCSPHIGHO2_01_FULL_35_10]OGK39861.1 MAG: hypothetical protein A3A74_03145 [Candidatus Roizmanbacteria bacterium RIFCSPLOWO2_01_FULL_35_13]